MSKNPDQGSEEFVEDYIGERYAPSGCCFSSVAIVAAYVYYFILWKITFLCVVIPAIIACVLLLGASVTYSWKVRIRQVIFVLLAFAPIAFMFAMDWCHWKP